MPRHKKNVEHAPIKNRDWYNDAATAALNSKSPYSEVIHFDGRDIIWFRMDSKDSSENQCLRWQTIIDGDECWVVESHNGLPGHKKTYNWSRNLHFIGLSTSNRNILDEVGIGGNVSGKAQTLKKAFTALHSAPKNRIKQLRKAANVVESYCHSKYPALTL